MSDKIKIVVPEINFNNKSRLIMLAVAKFDQGFVVRNILPNKTVALTNAGDIMGMAAQIADAIFDTIQRTLKDNKAVTLNIQIQDGQIGVIPIGFDKINDANMLQKLFFSLSPLLGKGAMSGFKNNAPYQEVFSDAIENDANQRLVFDPNLLAQRFVENPPIFGSGYNTSPFFVVPNDDDNDAAGKVLNSTQDQKKGGSKVNETINGNKTRLEA